MTNETDAGEANAGAHTSRARSGGAGRSGGQRPRDAVTMDDRRRRPGRPAYAGFNDGVERVFCAAVRHRLPERFPVHIRGDVAVRKIEAVAERAGAVLLCDGSHVGPHAWPDGEPAPSVKDDAGSAAGPDSGP